ncbi:hypothetical protein COMA1_10831 [Candidatus Nitrospira nitrosa]|uniref:Uncharacterized protein n=1 Tax=Candidatus Nitrospira nitrosa TaxID=1742972 RepID=A0A0S4LAG0_9BACT|nr:hypothetical protein COMA1_10831 [Candidatus Nitrospira nitrosa]
MPVTCSRLTPLQDTIGPHLIRESPDGPIRSPPLDYNLL